MLKNYFKIAFRNLSRNKGFSVINISGLAIGMAAVMLIGIWVQNNHIGEHWFVWPFYLYYPSAGKRNWAKKSIRCKH